MSHFGKKIEHWKILDFEAANSHQEVVYCRHMVMELANYWDRDVGILGQVGEYFVCFDMLLKSFGILSPESQQIYKKVQLEGVPDSLIDIKLIKSETPSSTQKGPIPSFNALLRLAQSKLVGETNERTEMFKIVKVQATVGESSLRYNLLR